jgi:hypothetical protein
MIIMGGKSGIIGFQVRLDPFRFYSLKFEALPK